MLYCDQEIALLHDEVFKLRQTLLLGSNTTANGVSLAFSAETIVTETIVTETSVTEGGYCVYHGINEAGEVKYVGITSQDPEIRFGEHYSSGTERASLQYDVISDATNLSKMEARIYEQNLINFYGIGENGQLFNKINSIAPKFWKLHNIKP